MPVSASSAANPIVTGYNSAPSYSGKTASSTWTVVIIAAAVVLAVWFWRKK